MIVESFENLNELYSFIVRTIMLKGEKGHNRTRTVLKHAYFRINDNVFDRNERIERFIPIDVETKKNYIINTYYEGIFREFKGCIRLRNDSTKVFYIPTKKEPCIAFISISAQTNGTMEITVFFRVARAFPTLYIDMIALSEVMKELKIKQANVCFNNIFIQRESILMDLAFSEHEQSEHFKKAVNSWKRAFNKPAEDIKFMSNRRLKIFYDEVKNNA